MAETSNLYLKEQELIKQYPKDQLLARRNFVVEDLLKYIGITVDFGHLPQGYLGLYHQDFLVEEVTTDGRLIDILPQTASCPAPADNQNKTLYADLVKVGLSTVESSQELARLLDLPLEKISYAGIKDKVAITAQQISITDADYQKINQLKTKAMFLKNYHWGQGNIYKGKLRGNQFTIIIRTPVTLGQGWLDSQLERYRDGFYNFYYLQRFGFVSARPFGHIIGRLILQEKYEAAVKMFMTDNNFQDVPLLNQIRNQAKENFGNWKKLEEIFSQLPYTFGLENEMAKYLQKSPKDYSGAIKVDLDRFTLWVYGYGSYLFNLHLSKLINEKRKIPKRLPLLLNSKYKQIDTYVENLANDKITDLEGVLKRIFNKEIMRPQNTCATVAPIKIIAARIFNKGVVLSFRLPLGSYATTFLSHLFLLYRGLPLAEWVDQQRYESKKILGSGSLEPVEKIFKDYLFNQILESS